MGQVSLGSYAKSKNMWTWGRSSFCSQYQRFKDSCTHFLINLLIVHFGLSSISIHILVENARKFRESAPNQIPIFLKPPPRVGVSENVWFFKFERVDRANTRRKEQIYTSSVQRKGADYAARALKSMIQGARPNFPTFSENLGYEGHCWVYGQKTVRRLFRG